VANIINFLWPLLRHVFLYDLTELRKERRNYGRKKLYNIATGLQGQTTQKPKLKPFYSFLDEVSQSPRNGR
jgi:hypothetical protein